MVKRSLAALLGALVLVAMVPATASAVITPCTGRIGDLVWVDLDRDGFQDATEPGIAGVTVTLLDGGGNVVQTATTGSDGRYEFLNVCPDLPYTVKVTAGVPAGFDPTPTATCRNNGDDFNPTDSNDPAGTSVTLTAATPANPTLDFGFVPPCEGTIGDFVWVDQNRNGLQDAGEPGIAGVTVQLFNAAGDLLQTAITNGAGNYQFTGVCPYVPYVVKVTEGVPADFTPTTIGSSDGNDLVAGDSNNPAGTTVVLPTTTNTNANPTLDFGFVPPCDGTIGDFVWIDQNRNGLQDLGEPGIAGVTVQLFTSAGSLLQTSVTDGSGNYLFTGVCPFLPYTVKVMGGVPADFTPTTVGSSDGNNLVPNDSNNPDGTTVSLPTSGGANANPTLDFGYVAPCNGTIGDFVWEDLNRNGQQDTGEPGISGVTVQLFDAMNQVVQTAVSGATGQYQFTGICPFIPYTVKVTAVPAGYLPTLIGSANGNDLVQNDSNNPDSTTVSLPTTAGGNANPTLDFGYFRPASLGDLVWEDRNANGRQDGDEPGIPGAVITLTDCAGNSVSDVFGNTVGPQTTGADGFYKFLNLLPGQYRITVTLPSGYSFTMAFQGGDPAADSNVNPADGTSDCRTLTSGQNDATVDAGAVRPASLGDFVWEDLNRNGQQDGGEPGIPGVLVTLLNCDGTPAGQTDTTDANGFYLFDNLAPGCYRVAFDTPGGYTPTLANTGNDATDSDPVGGVTGDYTLVSGQTTLTVDAGFYRPAALGDYVWNDANANGVQDNGEGGIEGATVTLTDCSGNPVTDVNGNPVGPYTTGANGSYQFTNLVPGQYQVTVTLPGGYVFTLRYQGGNTALDSNVDPATGQSECVTLASGENHPTIDAGAYVPAPSIDIEKFVNSQDADAAPGVYVTPGASVTWTFTVTNTGNVTLSNVTVTDPLLGPVTCPKTTLEPGESMDCTPISGTAVVGQHTNTATVTGTSPQGVMATDSDPANYFGASPSIDLEKLVNGEDADTPTGPVVAVGSDSTVTFSFVVTNTGNVTLAPVVVTDNVYGAICTIASLAPGASQSCTKTALAAEGQHTNTGTATGTPPPGVTPSPVTDTDPGNYFGFVPATCSVNLTKECAVVPPPPSQNWTCSSAKPIDCLTMVWNRPESVTVTAWKGTVGSTQLTVTVKQADGSPNLDGTIDFGDVVTVCGMGGSPNDQNWQVFVAGSGTLLGTSQFHISCSDPAMDGPDDCGSAQGDGKANSSSLLNGWKLEGMKGANNQSFTCTPAPQQLVWQDSCEITPQSNPSCATLGKPTSLTFKYEPAACATNNNPQGGKYTCTGNVPGSPATITSTNTGLVISPSSVTAGQEFTVTGSFGADTVFNVGGQVIKIHTSCSQVLEVGNVFASLKLVAFNGNRGGTQVAYRYKVTNLSNGALSYSLVDRVGATTVYEKLNQSLAAGASMTFEDFVASLNAATTNTATVTGTVGLPPNQAMCEPATASVTVNVPPSPPCSLSTGTPTIASKQVKWSISNTGSVRVVLSQLSLVWPAANGKLMKVKLDADTIYDPDRVWSAAGITLTSGDLVTDVKKKRIDPGKTRVLILEFEKNAVMDLSQYALTVNFGEGAGCALTMPNTPGEPPIAACSDLKPIDGIVLQATVGVLNVDWYRTTVSDINNPTIVSLGSSGPIAAGESFDFDGFAAASATNDVDFVVTLANGTKVRSRFHRSCSDADMNDINDCGKLQGDGKDNSFPTGNIWRLADLLGNGKRLGCSPLP